MDNIPFSFIAPEEKRRDIKTIHWVCSPDLNPRLGVWTWQRLTSELSLNHTWFRQVSCLSSKSALILWAERTHFSYLKKINMKNELQVNYIFPSSYRSRPCRFKYGQTTFLFLKISSYDLKPEDWQMALTNPQHSSLSKLSSHSTFLCVFLST